MTPAIVFKSHSLLLSSVSLQTSRFLSHSIRFGPVFTLQNPFLPLIYCRTTATMPLTTATGGESPEIVQLPDRIELNDKERLIFDRLLEAVRHYGLHTQLRVAGGWVRDKLLGKECYDIDIALDNMLGYEFCEKVNDYLSSTGEKVHEIGLIQRNPEQSKHLETARLRLYNLWIDFVNLRSEDYSENSRIPRMRFGTAEEDAYRRDLTINSLFYNLNTDSVEDFTRRGLADLKSGKIVTPLPPKDTFLDDPLRVLRAIRFGSRFRFTLDEELKKAAAADDVKAAIADKISRERIGHEIDLMISGNEPVKAMAYIANLGLFGVVFELPPALHPPISEGCDRVCISYIDAAWKLMQMIGSSTFNDEQRRLCLYAALFLPFRKSVYQDRKSKKIPAVNHVFRYSLKLKASDAETVISLHKAIDRFLSLIPFIEPNEVIQRDSKIRVLLGLLLREIKEFWRPALLLSALLHPTMIDYTANPSDEEFQLHKRKIYDRIESEVGKQGLEKIWEVKPLVNGKDIMSVLQLKTGGPVVKEWQEKLLEWQLAHPNGTADDCINWMKETYSKRARTE